MSSPVQGFYAHPAQPASLVETIATVIEEINQAKVATLYSWTSLNVTGKFLVREICKEIDERPLFICDLTYVNPNVLFELGYAIARRKRIWITLDPSYPPAQPNYKRLGLLTTIGYAKYSNSADIIRRFYDESPYTSSFR